MFDLGGKIVLEDSFSATLELLERQSADATRALDELDGKEIQIETASAEQSLERITRQSEEFLAEVNAPLEKLGADVFEKIQAMGGISPEGLEALTKELGASAAGMIQAREEAEALADGVTKAAADIDRMALSLAGLAPGDEIKAWRAQALGSLAGSWDDLRQTDAFGRQVLLAEREAKSQEFVDSWKEALEEPVEPADRLGEALSTIGSMARWAAAGFGLMGAANIIGDLTQMGAEAVSLGEALDGLGERAGVNSRQIVEEIQAASNGTVSSVQAMITVNRALLEQNADVAARLPEVYNVANAAAKALGRDSAQAFEAATNAILRGNPALLRQIGLYVDGQAELDAYAISQGKLTSELTQSDKEMATLNVLLREGAPLIEATGAAAAGAADQMQSLPVAIREVKTAFGELLVAVGVADVFGEFAGLFGNMAEQARAMSEVDSLSGKLIEQGDVELATQFHEQLIAIDQAQNTALLRGEDAAKAYETKRAAQLALIETMRQEVEINAASTGSYAEQIAIMGRGTVAIEEETAALNAFNAALNETRNQAGGLNTLAGAFGDIKGSLESIAGYAPQMPEIGKGLFGADAAELREFVMAAAEAQPNLYALDETGRSLVATTLAQIDAFEQQQQAVLTAAQAMPSASAGLQLLAQAAIGAGAGALDLVNNWEQFGPLALQVASEAETIEAALQELRVAAAQKVTIDVQVRGAQNALSTLRGIATGLIGSQGLTGAYDWYRQEADDFMRHYEKLGSISTDAQEFFLAGARQMWQENASITANGSQIVEQEYAAHGSQMAGLASDLRSGIERALQAGGEVTAEQMLAAEAGTYEDVAMENARRLDAIAARGFEELKAHPDWAGLLGIPPEVMAQGEQALKAWSARMAGETRNLLHPELIDWDAFVREFQQDKTDALQKEETIKIAIEKLEAAGVDVGPAGAELKAQIEAYLSGSPTNLNAEFDVAPGTIPATVERATGGQPITIEALFEAALQIAGVTEADLPQVEITPTLNVPERVELPGADLEVTPRVDAAAIGEQVKAAEKVDLEVATKGLTTDEINERTKAVNAYGFAVASNPPKAELPADVKPGATPELPATTLRAEVVATTPPLAEVELPARVAVIEGGATPPLSETILPARVEPGEVPQLPGAVIQASVVTPEMLTLPVTELPVELRLGDLPPLPEATLIARIEPALPVLPEIVWRAQVEAELPELPTAELAARVVIEEGGETPPLPETTLPARVVPEVPELTAVDLAARVIPETPSLEVADLPARIIPGETPELPETELRARVVPEVPVLTAVELAARVIPETPELATAELAAQIVPGETPELAATELRARVMPETPELERVDLAARVVPEVPELIPAELAARIVPGETPLLAETDLPVRVTPVTPVLPTAELLATVTPITPEEITAQMSLIPVVDEVALPGNYERLLMLAPQVDETQIPQEFAATLRLDRDELETAGAEDESDLTGLLDGVAAAQAEAITAGADIAGGLYASFQAAIQAQDAGALIATAWAEDIANSAGLFDALGRSVGADVAAGFVFAVEQGVGNVRRRLAEIVAPEVADILGRQGSVVLP